MPDRLPEVADLRQLEVDRRFFFSRLEFCQLSTRRTSNFIYTTKQRYVLSLLFPFSPCSMAIARSDVHMNTPNFELQLRDLNLQQSS